MRPTFLRFKVREAFFGFAHAHFVFGNLVAQEFLRLVGIGLLDAQRVLDERREHGFHDVARQHRVLVHVREDVGVRVARASCDHDTLREQLHRVFAVGLRARGVDHLGFERHALDVGAREIRRDMVAALALTSVPTASRSAAASAPNPSPRGSGHATRIHWGSARWLPTPPGNDPGRGDRGPTIPPAAADLDQHLLQEIRHVARVLGCRCATQRFITPAQSRRGAFTDSSGEKCEVRRTLPGPGGQSLLRRFGRLE